MNRAIYLDFDKPASPYDIEMLEKRILDVSKMTDSLAYLCEFHNTARGFHAIVSVAWRDKRELTPTETVCFQLLFGSDPKRECFNLLRAHHLGDAPDFWRDRWNVLYSEKL